MTKINPLSKIAKQLGAIGGKKSVESRFKGKSKEEISKEMSRVRMYNQRYTPEDKKKIDNMTEEFVKGLNENVNKSHPQ